VAVNAIHLCQVAELRVPFDVVLVMTKAYDTRWATELIKPLVAPGGLVAGVQNGMTLDDIAAVVGPERTLGVVIEMGGAMWQPGLVERDTPPDRAWFAVGGEHPAAHARAGEIAALLSHVGTVEVRERIRHSKWMKLIVNAAEVAPTAMLDLPMDAAIATPGVREYMLEVGREAIEVAAALGYPLIPVFGLPDLDLTDPRRYVGELLDVVIEHMGQPGSRTAMLQDWDKGRRSEVEEMNGIVVAEGRGLGIPTPFNAHILDLSRRVEAGELHQSPSNAALLAAFRP